MPFYNTQLGRFGDVCSMHVRSHGDPDQKAAHALACDGDCNPSRPNLKAVLGTKLLYEPNDPDHDWQTWKSIFSAELSKYQTGGGSPLKGYCGKKWPSLPKGFCLHELTPPLQYWSLRSFASRMKGTTVRRRGPLGVDHSAKPLWNYVITAIGEILVASEDFGWIKHTSIAGGMEVWSAGQIGLENGSLRLIDLQSGHYVISNILPVSMLANKLISFTEIVFKEYFKVFSLKNLAPSFVCIWG